MLILLLRYVILPSVLCLHVAAAECGCTYYRNIFRYSNYPGFNGRIVGGMEAPPHAFPWQAIVQRSFPFVGTCGGSLIQLDKSRNDSDLVLTAAHCLYDKDRNLWIDPKNVTVTLGAHNSLNPYESTRIVCLVHDYVTHLYHPHSTVNDIALLKLLTPVVHTSTIGPICVPEEKDVILPGAFCLAIGWGAADSWESIGSLRMVDLMVTTPQACDGTPLHHPQEICVRDFSRRGICNGDSGGPLMCQQRDKYFIFGIASWITECGHISAFANVSYYSDWIRSAAEWLGQRVTYVERTHTP